MKKAVLVMFLYVVAVGFNFASAQQTKDGNMKTQELNTAQFIELVMDYRTNPGKWAFKGKRPAVIDFYATWCGPCKVLSPVLNELAAEYGDKIDIYKIDIDKNRDLAQAFNVKAVPTLIFTPLNGTPTLVQGGLPKSDLKREIDKLLQSK